MTESIIAFFTKIGGNKGVIFEGKISLKKKTVQMTFFANLLKKKKKMSMASCLLSGGR